MPSQAFCVLLSISNLSWPFLFLFPFKIISFWKQIPRNVNKFHPRNYNCMCNFLLVLKQFQKTLPCRHVQSLANTISLCWLWPCCEVLAHGSELLCPHRGRAMEMSKDGVLLIGCALRKDIQGHKGNTLALKTQIVVYFLFKGHSFILMSIWFCIPSWRGCLEALYFSTWACCNKVSTEFILKNNNK